MRTQIKSPSLAEAQLLHEIEDVSKYALDSLGVRPDYIANLKEFQRNVDPKTRCYREYMQILDRLAAYAAKLERSREERKTTIATSPYRRQL
jgi:hypothetical protein